MNWTFGIGLLGQFCFILILLAGSSYGSYSCIIMFLFFQSIACISLAVHGAYLQHASRYCGTDRSRHRHKVICEGKRGDFKILCIIKLINTRVCTWQAGRQARRLGHHEEQVQACRYLVMPLCLVLPGIADPLPSPHHFSIRSCPMDVISWYSSTRIHFGNRSLSRASRLKRLIICRGIALSNQPGHTTRMAPTEGERPTKRARQGCDGCR